MFVYSLTKDYQKINPEIMECRAYVWNLSYQGKNQMAALICFMCMKTFFILFVFFTILFRL